MCRGCTIAFNHHDNMNTKYYFIPNLQMAKPMFITVKEPSMTINEEDKEPLFIT